MADKTSDEIKAEYVTKMGQDLGELFDALAHELAWLHWRWNQYRILFGDKPERIDLLNEAAPFFFYVVQSVFFEDTLLGIARLLERGKPSGKLTLTIKSLVRFIPDRKLQLRQEVERLTGEAVKAGAFASDWRHRHLAHRNLDLSLGKSAKPLAPASQKQVEDALSALRAVLNEIERHYLHTSTAYSGSVALGDAKSLLYALRNGSLRERDKHAAWARGEMHEDDIHPPPEP